jgi:putative ABC transport system permease protein
MKRIYSWLLRAYPASFRDEYGRPMEQQFLDEYADVGSRAARVRLFIRALRDVATSAPLEVCRELRQDLVYVWRVYRTRPTTALLAVLALSLALGACTGVFTVVNAVLLRNLPFSAPEQLVELWRGPVSAMAGRAAFSKWTRGSAYLQDATAFSPSEMNVGTSLGSFRIGVAETSGNFFDLLGTRLAAGRPFGPDEDVPGAPLVAVVSHALWLQSFGGDPAALGQTIDVNGRAAVVIGVAPPRFDYPAKTSVWVPTVYSSEVIPKEGAVAFHTIGRLKPHMNPHAARRLFNAEVTQRAPDAPHQDPANQPRLDQLRERIAGPIGTAMPVLAAMSGCVLLIACVNVSLLLVARTNERSQELAIRTALGASRGRIIQQLTTEATVLTVAGATCGLIVAHWTAELVSRVLPPALATQSYTTLDPRVIGFALLLASLIGLVFGAAPLLFTRRSELAHLHSQSRAVTAGRGLKRFRAGLVCMQAALTLLLIAGSITMGRTFLRLLDTDLGYRPSDVATVSTSLHGSKYRTSKDRWRYQSSALERLRSVPGVETAGAVTYLPLVANMFMATGLTLDTGVTIGPVVVNAATDGFFSSMGIRIISGRDFLPYDSKGQPAVIVNTALAERTGLGPGILGRRVKTSWSVTPYTVVGVADTIRFGGPTDRGHPRVYFQTGEEPSAVLTFVARGSGDAKSLATRCRDVLRAIDKDVSIFDAKPLADRLDEVLARPRFYTLAIGFLSGLAVLLAAIGVYGTVAHAAAQRTREMGIRLALGATRRRIRTMLLGESIGPLAVGCLAGCLVAAQWVRPALQSLVEGVDAIGAPACTVAAALLVVIGTVAALAATAGLRRIDPAEAIRAE